VKAALDSADHDLNSKGPVAVSRYATGKPVVTGEKPMSQETLEFSDGETNAKLLVWIVKGRGVAKDIRHQVKRAPRQPKARRRGMYGFSFGTRTG
jgi:dienelactone hydrolase